MAQTKFTGLPLELQTMIYDFLVPRGTSYFTAQRMRDPQDESTPSHAKCAPAPRIHETIFVNAEVQVTDFLGPLGSNRAIRREMLIKLYRNLRGVFEFYIAPDFNLIPRWILETVQVMSLRRHIEDQTKSQWVLHFPHLKFVYVKEYVRLSPIVPWRAGLNPETRHGGMGFLRDWYANYAWRSGSLMIHPELEPPSRSVDALIPASWQGHRVQFCVKLVILPQGMEEGGHSNEGAIAYLNYTRRKCPAMLVESFTKLRTRDAVPRPYEQGPHAPSYVCAKRFEWHRNTIII